MSIAWICLMLFCARVSSSPISAPLPPDTTPEAAETSAEGDNPEYDLEGSTEGTDPIRSRRHDGQPSYCQLFCRVGLFLEMDEDGKISGTGVDGSPNARLFEIMAMPDRDNEIITIKNSVTKKYIAIDQAGKLFATDMELLETRFIRRKNIGAYHTLETLSGNTADAKYLGMDRKGHCKILTERSDETDILFVQTNYLAEADGKDYGRGGSESKKKDDSL